MNDEMIVRSLRALADPTRLQIVRFLAGSCCGRAEVTDEGGVIAPTAGEVCCHITGATKITSTISHHLHELRDAGLVRLERSGKNTLCQLETGAFDELAQVLRGMTEPPTTPVPCSPPVLRVLFVCVHNAGRSQMAEAFVNHYARERGLPVVGESAGTMGGKVLNPIAVEAMIELGISMEGQSPKLLSQAQADGADRIISMGCGVDAAACPAKFLLTEDWGLDDPAGQSIERVRQIRDEIGRRVAAMLDELCA
jgi:arsenate reductase